jgi:hypothetical protein
MMVPAEPAPTATKLKECYCGYITAKTFHFAVGCTGSVEYVRQENCITHQEFRKLQDSSMKTHM